MFHRIMVCCSFLCLLPGSRVVGAELRIGTFDGERGGIGSLLSPDREWVRTAIDTSFVGVNITGTPVLTEALLDTLDLLWLDAVAAGTQPIDPLSAPEQMLLIQFVQDGGGVIIFTDTDLFVAANQSLLGPFGLLSAGSLAGDCHVTVTDPQATGVTDACFGLVENYWTGWPGWYADLGPHAQGLATLDDNGQTHLAFIDRAVLGTQAGGAVFMADHRTASLPLMLNAILAVTPAAVTAVGDEGDVPHAASLKSIFPNPFNPHVTLLVHLREPGPARLTVHDVRGGLVATVFEGWLDAGRQKVLWTVGGSDLDRLPTGIYLCRLQAGGQVVSRKAILLK